MTNKNEKTLPLMTGWKAAIRSNWVNEFSIMRPPVFCNIIAP